MQQSFSWIQADPNTPPARATEKRHNQPRDTRPTRLPSARLQALHDRLSHELRPEASDLHRLSAQLLSERRLSTARENMLTPAREARCAINGVLDQMDDKAPGIGGLLGACWLMSRHTPSWEHLLAARLDEGLREQQILHPALLAAQIVLIDEVRTQLPETIAVLRRTWKASLGPGTDQLPGLLLLRQELGYDAALAQMLRDRAQNRLRRSFQLPQWEGLMAEAAPHLERTRAWLTPPSTA